LATFLVLPPLSPRYGRNCARTVIVRRLILHLPITQIDHHKAGLVRSDGVSNGRSQTCCVGPSTPTKPDPLRLYDGQLIVDIDNDCGSRRTL
jgi:hypothetical protein